MGISCYNAVKGCFLFSLCVCGSDPAFVRLMVNLHLFMGDVRMFAHSGDYVTAVAV